MEKKKTIDDIEKLSLVKKREAERNYTWDTLKHFNKVSTIIIVFIK